ncbi:MAG: hypothetical protein M3Y69_03755 [Verrucomicrobiota bacterium]|nr:hypothetical protein [Verrucomicrobiota bacterium]
MPNYGYHLARAHGAAVRRMYATALPAIVRRLIAQPRTLPFEVYAYSSESDLPEQVASIRSFLRFAGRPLRFVVVSDGTHTPRSISLLEAIDRSVEVRQAGDEVLDGSSARLHTYLTVHPTGKQLALIMSLPAEAPALYIDSDVLFFAGAKDLSDIERPANCSAYYLRDCRLSADERLFRNDDEKLSPVNTGVLFLFEKLDWTEGLERFDRLDGPPDFFTNQTMTHLTMHAAGASPLDPSNYVLQLDDQFVYRDAYADQRIVLRHYVRPVRHKFWTTLANSKWRA